LLTADLVHARRTGKELRLVKADAKARAHALECAELVLATYAAHVGATREEIETALDAACMRLDDGPRARKTLAGLRKLAEDSAEFAAPSDEGIDPVAVRRTVFLAAARARRLLEDDGTFDRDRVLEVAAQAMEMTVERTEEALYADLRAAHRLARAPTMNAPMLLEAWESGQAQAVLLRAVRVEVWVSCASAAAYRALFHKLKFLRLLHEIHPLAPDQAWPEPSKHKGGHRIVIDGPFSLFESVTKYGLQLAMIVPALRECDAFHLEADVRWGATRSSLSFHLDGGVRGREVTIPPDPPEEVEALVKSFLALESDWQVRVPQDILHLPGIGLSVPDLVFQHVSGKRVHLEVLGFWSREAVWRRVELVEKGLEHPMLFAVGKRLRVREDVLDADLPSALLVYKGTIPARTVLERLEMLRARVRPSRR
jgi:predicted nuclease of restriction endonuclease-like RecB superfamily